MKRAIAAAALVLLAATGCGGGGDDKITVSNPGSSTSPSSALPSTAASVLAGLTSGECASIAGEFSKASSSFSSQDQTTPYSERFKAISEAFDAAADKIDDAAPKAAMKKIAEVYGNVAKGMQGVDYTPGSGKAPPAAYLAALKSFSDPDFRSATTTMSAYFAGGCK